MKVLTLDFSSRSRVFGLVQWDGHAHLIAESSDRDFRRKSALSLIEELLTRSAVTPAEIGLIALGIGPGSYTGIRISIAIAQGWQLAHGCQVAPASTLPVLARQLQRHHHPARFDLIVDAQRDELYVQSFNGSALLAEPTELRIVKVADFQAAHSPIVAGPEADRWIPDGLVVYPQSIDLATVALCSNQFVPAETLEPITLRPATFVKLQNQGKP